MGGILIYSDKSGIMLELATAAGQMKPENIKIAALTINNSQQAQELADLGLWVCSIHHPRLLIADTANLASALGQVAEKLEIDTFLLASDRRGKELAGRLAQALGAGCVTDVKGFNAENGELCFARNALGGATVAAVAVKTPRKVIAISPGAFKPATRPNQGSIQSVDIQLPPPSVKLLETKARAGDAVDIQASPRLVVVGQGVENQADLTPVHQVADALGAEIACSKPVASDRKWFAEDRIVGLSGKICKPELALILGVSGQVQFTVGIREARVIASINNDENAYMNKISDYVLVADIQAALPALAEALGKIK